MNLDRKLFRQLVDLRILVTRYHTVPLLPATCYLLPSTYSPTEDIRIPISTVSARYHFSLAAA